MAKIIENKRGRRTIKLNTDDILAVVREYQCLTFGIYKYNNIRKKLETSNFFIPED